MGQILALGVDVNFPLHLQEQREEWLSSLYKDTAVKVRTISEGPVYLESACDQAIAGKGILDQVIKAEEEGFNAVGILCMSDPFIDACREAVKIPVIGACQASFYLATLLVNKVSMVTISDTAVPLLWKVLKNTGIDLSTVSSIRAINMEIEEMVASPETTLERLKQVSQQAVTEDKAEAIILGCTEMGKPVQLILADYLQVPVVDPNVATISMAVSLMGSELASQKKQHKRYSISERYVGL